MANYYNWEATLTYSDGSTAVASSSLHLKDLRFAEMRVLRYLGNPDCGEDMRQAVRRLRLCKVVVSYEEVSKADVLPWKEVVWKYNAAPGGPPVTVYDLKREREKQEEREAVRAARWERAAAYERECREAERKAKEGL